jgi:hypothetical protein
MKGVPPETSEFCSVLTKQNNLEYLHYIYLTIQLALYHVLCLLPAIFLRSRHSDSYTFNLRHSAARSSPSLAQDAAEIFESSKTRGTVQRQGTGCGGVFQSASCGLPLATWLFSTSRRRSHGLTTGRCHTAGTNHKVVKYTACNRDSIQNNTLVIIRFYSIQTVLGSNSRVQNSLLKWKGIWIVLKG